MGQIDRRRLTEIEGNQEKLVGILQKKYGYGKDEAEREYEDFISRHGKKAA